MRFWGMVSSSLKGGAKNTVLFNFGDLAGPDLKALGLANRVFDELLTTAMSSYNIVYLDSLHCWLVLMSMVDGG